MTVTSSEEAHEPQLRPAIVLSTSEDACTVITADKPAVVPYAAFFPSPRIERVTPGHLVAIAVVPDASDVVVWRWYDAVVLGYADGLVRLWEPAHGEVLALARDPRHPHPPGSRAYLSAGLPGSDWWVAGTAVAHAEAAVVELDEVQEFITRHNLWGLS